MINFLHKYLALKNCKCEMCEPKTPKGFMRISARGCEYVWFEK